MEHLLEVKSLSTSFEVAAGEVRSVNDISFYIDKNEILGVVGESGSGKSVTASSLMQILAKSGHIKNGSSIIFEGEELVGMNERDLRKIRGNKIAMIFQDPMTALNPVLTIGHQMEEVMLLHRNDPVDKLCEEESRRLRTLETEFNGLVMDESELDKENEADQVKLAEIEKAKEALSKDIATAKVDYILARKKADKKIEIKKRRETSLYKIRDNYLKLDGKVKLEELISSTSLRHNYLVKKRDIYVRPEFKDMIDKLTKFDSSRGDLYKKYINDVQELKEFIGGVDIKEDEKKAAEDKVMVIKNDFKVNIAKVEQEKAELIEKIKTYFKEENKKIEDEYKEKKKDKDAKAKYKRQAKLVLPSEFTKVEIQNKKTRKEEYEKFRAQFGNTKYSAYKESIKMLELVGVNSPEKRMKQYPYEFSGGMLQRVMIAMALLTKPDLLIADEPTTALDVTIQAQILELIKSIQEKLGMGVLIITHDLGVVAQICDRVNVMYAGKIVEQGNVRDIFYNPKHEYTKGLLGSMPGKDAEKGKKLNPIKGSPVDVFALPKGCSFSPRCDKCMEICLKKYPLMKDYGDGHKACCFSSYYELLEKGKISKEEFVAYMNDSSEMVNPLTKKEEKARKAAEKKIKKEESEDGK